MADKPYLDKTGLSEFWTAIKDYVSSHGGGGSVTGVKGDSEGTYRTGNVNITKANIGLGNVDNKSSSTIKSELLDIFYPIGSYYETSDSEFDPNTEWGGTWVAEEEGKAHISAGTTYIAGTEYGSSTHHHTTGTTALQVKHLPAHTHGSKTLTGTASAWTDTGLIGTSVTPTGIISKGTAFAHGTMDTTAYGKGYGLKITATHEHTSVGSGTEHGHGNTGDSSSMQPSIAVYRWHRTA